MIYLRLKALTMALVLFPVALCYGANLEQADQLGKVGAEGQGLSSSTWHFVHNQIDKGKPDTATGSPTFFEESTVLSSVDSQPKVLKCPCTLFWNNGEVVPPLKTINLTGATSRWAPPRNPAIGRAGMGCTQVGSGSMNYNYGMGIQSCSKGSKNVFDGIPFNPRVDKAVFEACRKLLRAQHCPI